MELGQKGWLDTFTGLVARPHVVAERLDDVVRRHTDVRGPALQHLDDCAKHPRHRTKRTVVLFVSTPVPVEMTKQLVRPVDKMNDHVAALRPIARETVLISNIVPDLKGSTSSRAIAVG